MNAMISSKQRTSRAARQNCDPQSSGQLRYKHLAFGVGLALGSLLVCGMASAAGAVAANQSPTGGKVVGGTGSISQSGASTVINQQSKLLALDWQTFNVGKDASVLFNQPGASAIALNRILDQNPSQIFGKVTSNGQIFLINTHGIIFGASAQLNVGGLVASTLDLTPQDFLKEHFSLDAHGVSAGVVNHGTIAAASGGSVSLVGGQVENDGLIVADYGHINLDGADTAVLDFDGNGLISVEITGALQQRLDADKAAVTNSGTLKATSGTVVLQASAAKNLFTDMVNNSGVIKAGGISTAGGEVRLVGSGGNVIDSGSIDVSGSTGGSVQVLADHDVAMSGNIRADATENGDGGNILVKGDDSAGISGSLSARGGAQGGNGGFIETSGTHVHFGDGTRVDTLAAFGQAGTWLIDPQDFTIATSGGDMTPTLLQTNLGTGDVQIKSSGGATAGAGDINVNDAITWGSHTLTLTAANNVNINASVSTTGSAGLILQPATTNTTGGTTDNGVIGGTVVIGSAGALSLAGSGTLNLSNAITNNGALSFGLGGNFSYAGVISGTGTLSQSGTKTLKLTGVNTYTGATTIGSGSTLALDTGGSIADSSGVQADGTLDISGTSTGASIKSLSGAGTGKVVLGSKTLTLANALATIGSANTFAGIISGNGAVALSGGMQAFNGANTYKGGTTISSGTLQVAGDGSLGDSTGDVTINSNGTLQAGADFNSARTINIANTANIDTNGHAVTLSGDITSGDPSQGTLDKEGAGTLTLTGSTSEYKTTNVNAGTLALSGSAALGGKYFSVASGAIFDISQLTGAGTTIYTLDGGGTVDLGSKTLTAGAGNTAWTFSGVLADGGIGGGTGGSFVMDSTGITGILTGDNTYTGGTTITNGTLQLGNGTATGSVAGNVTNNGALVLGHSNAVSYGGVISGNGSLTQTGAGTLTLTGNNTFTGATTIDNGSTLALSGGNNYILQDSSGVTANGTLDISAATGSQFEEVQSLSGSGAVALGTNDLLITNASGNFGGVISGGGGLAIFGGTQTLSGNNTYTGTTTVGGGILSVASDANLGIGGLLTLDGGTLENTASFTLNHSISVGPSGGTLQNDTGTDLTVANAISGFGSLTQNGTGTLTLDGNVTTGGYTQTYNGAVALGNDINLTGTTVTLNAVTGNSHNLTVTGNAALDGALASLNNLLVTGTTALGTTGVTTTGTQEYDGALTLDGGNTNLSGTTVMLNGVTGNGNDLTVTGNAALDGAIAGVGNLAVSGATALGTTAVTTTGTQTYTGALTLNGGDTNLQGTTVTLNAVTGNTHNLTVTGNAALDGAVAGVNNLLITGATAFGTANLSTTGNQTYSGAVTLANDTTLTSSSGSVNFGSTVDSATATARSLNVDATAGQAGFGGAVGAIHALNNLSTNSQTLSALSTIKTAGDLSMTTTGGAIGQSAAWTVGGDAAFDAGNHAINLGIAGNDFTGQVGLTNSGANNVTLDNGSNALKLGNVNVGTGTLDISGTGITQVVGTGLVQAPGAGAASFDAHAGALNLNSTLNDLTGIVGLANSGNNLVYLDNGGNALTLGTLNVGSGPLTITDYGVGALLLTNDITTNGGAVTFGGAVTIDGSPAITVDTTGGGAAGANISFGGDVNAAAPNADSLTLTAGNGAVTFGGAVGNTAALNDLTTTSKTFTAASTLGIGGDLSITTTGGPISQGSAWTVAGTSTFNAGSNAITLTSPSNSFGGPITATGGAVELAGTGTLDMGAVTASTLKLDGASLLHDDITTTGAQTYNGAVTLDGSGNSVALHGNGITFASTVDNLSSANPQDFTVDSGTGAAQFNGAVGSLNGPLGALVVSGTGQAQFLGNVVAASLTASAPVLLDANVSTSGNQKYNGAVALGSNVVASSSNGNVSFASTVDNAVAGTPESLTVTAANGAATFGNVVGTLNGPLGNLTSSSGTFSATGALKIGGDLAVSTTTGAIGQSAAWTVAGNSVFNAGNNTVTLANPNNDFTGTVTVTGAGVSVRDMNDLTIGGLTDNNNGNVSLIAGGQLFGVGPINAGTGSITLTAAGAVLTTAALTGGDIALTGGNGISIGDNVNASGTLTLTSNTGSISEGSTAVITADTLTGTSSGSTHLDGNNLINNLGNFTANGGFSLTNAQALTVGAGIAIDGGAGGTTLTTTNGDITVNGTVGNAAGATSLTSAGNINEGAGGVVIGTQLTGASIGDTTLTGANKLASVGQFNADNFTLVNNAALSVAGPLVTTGDISLKTTGGPANVLNVGQALTGGSVTLDSAGDLSITQMVQGSAVDLTANGNLSIDAAVDSGAGATTLTQNGAGSISEGVGGSITAGTLTGTAQGSATLDGANAVTNLGDFTAVGFSLTNAADLTVAAGSTVDGGANTSLTTTGAGSDITIDGNVAGTATHLVSSGAINEGASGVVTANTLTGSAANAAQLTGNNAISQLGNFTAASLALTNGQSLTVLGGNTVDGGSSAALTIDGNLDIDGALKGTTTSLAATGTIGEGAAGAVVAGTLTGNSGGATNLSGNNAVASLGNFTADGFALTSNQTLTVNSGATVDGGANTTLTTSGSGHDIDINGTVKGDLITLVSAGAIGEGSGGLLQGGDLTGSSVGDTTLANTQVDDLDAFDAANFSLTNAGALTVNGPLSTAGNAGDISLTTTGTGNALTLNQVVQGATITLASAGDLTVADAVTGTQVALAANGNLAIDAAVSSGTGTTTLTQTGTGAITGGSNGSITAATLTGSATGTTTLGSAGQFMANHVDTLGGFSSPAGFSFTNDGTLTLASVGGSAFTVDAGKSALYLEVHNGDLLQVGSNWLYDGTGSFSAPDGHIGMQIAPIYVTGVSAQSVPAIGMPPAYFYAIDYSGNLLPLTGSNAVNVPTSILSSKSQGVNGHSDQYIDISVVTAIYRAYGIVPTGLLLPPDQSACSPDQPPTELCPENN